MGTDLPTPADLRERRTSLELTQSELADRADVSQPLIARIEGGDVDPRLSTLRRIVGALDEAESAVMHADDIMHEGVISVAPDDSVREAIDLMVKEGYSQLPVVRDGRPQGIISNSDIRQLDDENAGELPVADVMREAITTVEPDATLDEVNAHLNHQDAVMVVRDGQLEGIITEADVAAHMS
ncbi:CBS domain-containing protein [Natronomonas gomsonensis]|jgi:predicted transcriptional regulator|uniref:CBS domain-containing protein n=1 Tax=Natronomonas TaxID=63743 RepID=UPI0012EAE9DE|nr:MULTISPECIES: CBS domain-containing protein [Natronomonas]MCY4729354.1 CBS domain-containing protein [Natronomonas gomsonensis]MUV86027.1 CBS domain-containing protein [Natronomonas sp. CBA1123]